MSAHFTCLRWGSKVGSKKDQVLETTTTTNPVTITAGTRRMFDKDVPLPTTLQSKTKILISIQYHF